MAKVRTTMDCVGRTPASARLRPRPRLGKPAGRTEKSRARLTSLRALAVGLMVLGPVAQAHAASEMELLLDAKPVGDNVLASNRGGLRVQGLVFSITVEKKKTVNGEIEYHTYIVANDRYGWTRHETVTRGPGASDTLNNASQQASAAANSTADVINEQQQTASDVYEDASETVNQSAQETAQTLQEQQEAIADATSNQTVDASEDASNAGLDLAVAVNDSNVTPETGDNIAAAAEDLGTAVADIGSVGATATEGTVTPPAAAGTTEQRDSTDGNTAAAETEIGPAPSTEPASENNTAQSLATVDSQSAESTGASQAGAEDTTTVPSAPSTETVSDQTELTEIDLSGLPSSDTLDAESTEETEALELPPAPASSETSAAETSDAAETASSASSTASDAAQGSAPDVIDLVEETNEVGPTDVPGIGQDTPGTNAASGETSLAEVTPPVTDNANDMADAGDAPEPLVETQTEAPSAFFENDRVVLVSSDPILTNDLVRQILSSPTIITNNQNNAVIQEITRITINIDNFSALNQDLLHQQMSATVSDLVRTQVTSSLTRF